MTQFDLIILTNTKNNDYQNLVQTCIISYLESGDKHIDKIILMETNKNWDQNYLKTISPKIKCVCPGIPFNYNRFLNIALEFCNSSIICVSNNDVVVHKNCIPNVIKAFDEDSTLMSASPIDRGWHRNTYTDFPDDNVAYEGYETTKYLLGFNLYMRKTIYDKIGLYDERFDFYFQDNDYEACLKALNLKHCLLSFAQITHGQNKPQSEISDVDVRIKLMADQKKYLQKWNNLKFNNFKPYLKLGILTTHPDENLQNKYVAISTNMHEIDHCQYFFKCNMELTKSLLDNILKKINLITPDKIIIDNNNIVVRNF